MIGAEKTTKELIRDILILNNVKINGVKQKLQCRMRLVRIL